MVADRESAALAERLIEQTCQRHGILPGQLTVHVDRGFSMIAKPVALLLADLRPWTPSRLQRQSLLGGSL